MKVKNITSTNGRKVVNQFHIVDSDGAEYFQSYDSIICKRYEGIIILDEKYWDYSRTTGKYRNIFLGETKKKTR